MFKKINSLNQVILALIVSICTQAIAIKWFFQPAHLALGGVSGISLGMEYIFKPLHIPITYGAIAIVLNIPLVILAWRRINRWFSIFSLINIISSSLLIDFFPTIVLSNDIIVNALSGSVIYSFGVILCLQAGISQGGTDILGVYLSKNGKGSIGKVGLYVTVIAFILTYFTTTFTIIVYSFIANLILSIMIDKYYENSAKVTLLIVTKKVDRINSILQKKLKRGTTIWESRGGYKEEDSNILMITISSDQKSIVYNIVNKLDSKCFITTLSTESTIGEWTNRIGERKLNKKMFLSDIEEDNVQNKENDEK